MKAANLIFTWDKMREKWPDKRIKFFLCMFLKLNYGLIKVLALENRNAFLPILGILSLSSNPRSQVCINRD